MPRPALVLENVGKCYQPSSQRNDTLRDLLTLWWQFSRSGNSEIAIGLEARTVWALRGFNATIYPGETVGVIGHNGAGKSTLLKLISRITMPSEGRIIIYGKLVSLLEVGIGFHPDLTGRENVYLAGTLLRLSKHEIEQSIRSIREFAELGDAFDWPVRTYSTGMYMRLGFSVAAHLRGDIVLLDEVLAVGDLRFQQKCSTFLRQLRQRGATIILVSHNAFLVKSFCSRVLYLRQGRLIYDGDPTTALSMYEKDSYLGLPEWARESLVPSNSHGITIKDIDILDSTGQSARVFRFGDPMQVQVRLECRQNVGDLNVVISILRQDGLPCCAYSSYLDGVTLAGNQDTYLIQSTIPNIKWVAGSYRVDVLVWDTLFQKLYAAAKGPYISVKHPLLSKEFGIFHENAMWKVHPIVSATNGMSCS